MFHCITSLVLEYTLIFYCKNGAQHLLNCYTTRVFGYIIFAAWYLEATNL